MIFNAKTGLGYLWIKAVRDGQYTAEQVPNIGNLRDVVTAALNKNEGDT